MTDTKSASHLFLRFAKWTSHAAGHPVAFISAFLIIVIWAATGSIFHYSDTWQLVINTGTTIITFLMVFLIQNTQNRDSVAMQIKLDEIIRALEGAHNTLLDLENLQDEDLEQTRKNYLHLAQKAHEAIKRGETDTDVPDLEHLEDAELEKVQNAFARLADKARKVREARSKKIFKK